MPAGQDEVPAGRTAGAAVPEPRPALGNGAGPAPHPAPHTRSGVPLQRAPRVRWDPPPRPRIVDEPGILGLSRLTRSRMGSRLFTAFFVLVYTLIVVQMVYALLDRPW